MLAYLLLRAPSSLGIALFDQRTGIILPAKTHLSTVWPALAVEHICAVELHLGGINVLDHILFDLGVIIEHGNTVGHVASQVLLLLLVLVNHLLHWIDFCLDIVERPLLRFLHLYHHLLDLLELLEAVCLHLFKLFLFIYQHLEALVVMLTSEKGVFDNSWTILFNKWYSCVCILYPILVKVCYLLRVRLLGVRLLSWAGNVVCRVGWSVLTLSWRTIFRICGWLRWWRLLW